MLTNWSKIRDLESSKDETVPCHHFEVSFVWRNYNGEFVTCIMDITLSAYASRFLIIFFLANMKDH